MKVNVTNLLVPPHRIGKLAYVIHYLLPDCPSIPCLHSLFLLFSTVLYHTYCSWHHETQTRGLEESRHWFARQHTEGTDHYLWDTSICT